MTRFVLFLAMIFVSNTFVYAQDAAIEEIRAAFKEINSKKYTMERYTFEAAGCVDDGSLEYYLDKQQIVKIKESGLIGDGGWDTEYYYRNGNLIFIYESLIDGPASGKIVKREYRVYVKDGKVIRFMEDQKIIPADNKATEMTEIALRLLKAHSTKKFAEALCN